MIIHAFPGKITTLYAVQYPSGSVLLLDAGCACDKDAVVHHLKALGICEAGVKFVVASHAHPDHAGGASQWKRSGAYVAAPKGINLWYAGPLGWVQHRVDMGLVLFVEAAASRSPWSRIWLVLGELFSPSAPVRFPRSLDYDYVIPVPSPVASNAALSVLQPLVGPGSDAEAAFPELAEWRCVPVPGHTDHMAALWHAPSRTLYAADALLHLPHQPCELQPPVTIDFKALYVASVERLARLPVRNLLLAHGGSFRMEATATASDREETVEIRGHGKEAANVARLFAGGEWGTAVSALATRMRSKNRGLKGWRATMIGILNLPTLLSPRLFRIRRALNYRDQ